MTQVIHSNKSQCALILNHLKLYGSISQFTAIEKYGCYRLGARIYNLKREGFNIETHIVETTKGRRFAIYYLKTNNTKETK